MKVSTLIVGYIPLSDISGRKPRELRDDKYFKDLIAGFDLGEVNFASYNNFKEELDRVNPFITVVFGEWYAHQVSEHKKDTWIYVATAPSSIFSKKIEIEEKQKKQNELFRSIAGHVQQLKEEPEDKHDQLRKIAAMGEKDIYNMLIQAVIGKNEDLKQQAWALLTDNNAAPMFVWMRWYLMMDVWQHGDGKGKEGFLCMAMDQHVENGLARKMENFTDADGQEYHQYMFTHPAGFDAKYIRRIPIGFKGQDKYAYEAILTKYETPNGLRLMFEAGQMRTEKEKWLGAEK